LEDVGNLGRARVARQGEPSGGEVELGGADGRDAEHGQVGPRPVVVVAAVGLGGLLGLRSIDITSAADARCTMVVSLGS
jgi:hypothetical protein